MEQAERDLLDRTLRQVTEAHTGAALDEALAGLGWRDALRADARTAVALLFEHQGRAGATSSGLDDVVTAALGVAGQADVAVVLPGLDRFAPPGTVGGDTVSVTGLATARILQAGTALVVTTAGGGEAAARVPAAGLGRRQAGGMDPWMGLVEVTGAARAAAPTIPLEHGRWAGAVDRARLAVGHELVGASAAMLELACAHARERVQFGRPIAAFQAVRHRLADALVAVDSARALLEAAWEDGLPTTAAMAKAVSGRAGRASARHCQQVLAGMGFTTEHPLHRYVRRVFVLDELFGSARSLTAALGREVLAGRRLPAPLPL